MLNQFLSYLESRLSSSGVRGCRRFLGYRAHARRPDSNDTLLISHLGRGIVQREGSRRRSPTRFEVLSAWWKMVCVLLLESEATRGVRATRASREFGSILARPWLRGWHASWPTYRAPSTSTASAIGSTQNWKLGGLICRCS